VRCRLRNPGHRIPTIIPTASLSIQTGKGGAASIGGTETDTEIAPLIQKVGAASIAEIDRLIAELQEAKSYLLSEGERIEKEMVRYANLTQMALASAMIIFDAVSQWHPARKQQNASEVTAASTEEDIGAFRKSPQAPGEVSVTSLGSEAPL
jgi:hypothetical protein